jgi:hypothetical protein
MVQRDGPRLRWDYRTWIVATDPEHQMVKIGGLGSMGIGQMWVRDYPECAEDETYASAPMETCPEEERP